MHEFSIAQSLFELIEKFSVENQAAAVRSVKLRLGRLSGIEPHCLKQAFEVLKEGTIAREADLVMEIRDLKILCHHCGKESVLEDFVLICPPCGSTDLKVLDGEGMYLESLEIEK